MSNGGAWKGNIRARLYERVRERGYDSLTAFAEARPTASLVELAEELGKDDVAGVQVFGVLVDEAERRHQLTVWYADSLCANYGSVSPTAGQPCWMTPTVSRSLRLSARGLPTLQQPIRSASIQPAQRSSPIRRRPAGALSAPTMSCSARFSPTRKSDPPTVPKTAPRPSKTGARGRAS